MTETENIPEGFAPHFRKSSLTDPWEPLYSKQTEKAVVLGFRAAKAHTNSRGFVHGGLLSALADNAMGLSCAQLHGEEALAGLVTVNLGVDFLGSAELGEWVEVETQFVKTGRALDFAQCFITADGKPCARANATFRVRMKAA
ncbi:PaaI family thioesterase [Tepidicaulis sp. LMO-SS28]|uniref:PaaI family thioesterase n=1 Tax=Tepidicaulis sp. LMO-SS28 TaxID=3447455 RepID=UPI003EE0181F